MSITEVQRKVSRGSELKFLRTHVRCQPFAMQSESTQQKLQGGIKLRALTSVHGSHIHTLSVKN